MKTICKAVLLIIQTLQCLAADGTVFQSLMVIFFFFFLRLCAHVTMNKHSHNINALHADHMCKIIVHSVNFHGDFCSSVIIKSGKLTSHVKL